MVADIFGPPPPNFCFDTNVSVSSNYMTSELVRRIHAYFTGAFELLVTKIFSTAN